MRVPYTKPSTLSDPYFDWEGSEGKISKVIAADPETLGRDAYWMIFYQHLPAANYQEGCFYVPYFLDFYSKGADFEAPNLEGFFWFIDHFREDFERDGLIEPILERIWSIFLDRTNSFRIHRLSDEEIQQYKICESYREIVPGSRIVHELLDCFTSWEVYDPIIAKLKDHFSDTSSPTKSFWFCECAFHTRIWLWVDSEPVERRQDLFDHFHRFERFAAHYANTFAGRLAGGEDVLKGRGSYGSG
jgi:hypothetical protein